MKAELTLPDDLAKAIAREVVTALKPALAHRKGEEDAILTPDQLADYLGVAKGWIYEAASQKAIPYFKAGKFLRFRKSAIDAWITALSIPAVRPPTRPLRIIGGNTAR